MNLSRLDTPADNLAPYRIHSVREILAILSQIRRQRQLIRMSFSEGRERVMTSILDIDEARQLVYIDAAPYPAQNRRIALTQKLAFDTTLNRIPIQFTASGAQPCNHEGYAALRFALPQSLVRLQRRQSYRVNVPAAHPLHCVFMPPGTDIRPLEAPLPLDVHDLSIGGIAVIDPDYRLDGRPGAIYPVCQIDFPGYPVTVALEVRHTHISTLHSGKAVRRVGCRFVDTPSPMIALVQRYILKLEREQNARGQEAT